MLNLSYFLEQYKLNGSALVPTELVPLTELEWQQLDGLMLEVNYEKVVGGDTGDSHSVWVGRFVNDEIRPMPLSELTTPLVALIMSEKMQQWYGFFVTDEKLCLRRCQANVMKTGDFIGYHIDQDTTPDYTATFVFLLNDDFEGGEFVTYHMDSDPNHYRSKKYNVLVNRGDLPHEVTPVTSGCRRSLACFLSKNFGNTVKPRQKIKTLVTLD